MSQDKNAVGIIVNADGSQAKAELKDISNSLGKVATASGSASLWPG